VAEELFCGDASTGASMDIQQATGIARSMVRDWGMSEVLGPVKFSPDENKQAFFGEAKEYSDRTAELIDQEVRRLIQTAYDETHELLSARRTEMEALKDALMKYETIDGADVDKILAGEVINKPTVQDLLASEQQRRAADAKREAERHGHEEDSGPGVGAMPQPG
jgi:cell division protease FtsH